MPLDDEKNESQQEGLPSQNPSPHSGSSSINTPSLQAAPIGIDKHAEAASIFDGGADAVQVTGPEDLSAPYSVFSKGMKIWIVTLVAVSALISPFGATLFLPAMNELTKVLDISATQVNVAVTTYMVSLAVISRPGLGALPLVALSP